MTLEHVAVWTFQIERLKLFYENYFGARAGSLYINKEKGFRSYFLSFDQGARLEIMQMEGIPVSKNSAYQQFTGLIHMAFALESQAAVNKLTERLEKDGFEIIGPPRITGDNYYESVVLDPDNNRVEIIFNRNQQ